MSRFTKEEIEWLLDSGNPFFMFASSEDGRCSTVLCYGDGNSIPYELVYSKLSDTSVISNTESRGSARICMSRASVLGYLTGRGDPSIIREEKMQFMGAGSHVATTIILDLRSYFSLTKRRLDIRSSDQSVQLARKKTVAYLSSIALFYREKLYMLELYLLSNLHLEQKIWVAYKTIYAKTKEGDMNDQVYRVALSSNCDKYRSQARSLIDKML